MAVACGCHRCTSGGDQARCGARIWRLIVGLLDGSADMRRAMVEAATIRWLVDGLDPQGWAGDSPADCSMHTRMVAVRDLAEAWLAHDRPLDLLRGVEVMIRSEYVWNEGEDE